MLTPLTSNDIDKLWQYFSNNTTTDSVYVANVPVMHLAMGTAYFDRDVVDRNARQYRVRLRAGNGNEVSVAESNAVTMPATPDIPKPILRDVRAYGREIRDRKSTRLNSSH